MLKWLRAFGKPKSPTWQCSICNKAHDEVPSCFGSEAPWRAYVDEEEFERRVALSPDQCIIDGQYFFVRGHIEIPVRNQTQPLAFSVWSSLSEESHDHMSARWDNPDRVNDPGYFGWLSTTLPVYPDTTNLKLSVRMRAPGLTPLFELEPTDHPLSVDHRNGISEQQWHELAMRLLNRLPD